MSKPDILVGQAFRIRDEANPRRDSYRGFLALVSAAFTTKQGQWLTVVHQDAFGIEVMDYKREAFMKFALPDMMAQSTRAIFREFRCRHPLSEQWAKEALKLEALALAPRKEEAAQPIIMPTPTTYPFKLYSNDTHEFAIEVNRVPGFIFFIPILAGKKLEKFSLPSREFEGDWKQLPWCPVPKAVELVMEYISAGVLKASPEAKDFLRQALQPKETIMATTEEVKKPKVTKKTAAQKPEKKQAAQKTEKKSAVKKAAAPKAVKPAAEKAAKEKKVTVSSYLRELIGEGKLTDDEIFKKTQTKFSDLGDDKRWYVAWYRNDMKKKGLNPPTAVGAK